MDDDYGYTDYGYNDYEWDLKDDSEKTEWEEYYKTRNEKLTRKYTDEDDMFG